MAQSIYISIWLNISIKDQRGWYFIKTISKDIPLAEITLRKYPKPFNLEQRELVKKICLSIGLLQPGDSRDIITDILHAFVKQKKELSSKEVEDFAIQQRKQLNLPQVGIASSNIRRQLKRLKDLFLIERVGNNYRITENAKFSEIFAEKIEKYYLQTILERVKEYFSAIDEAHEWNISTSRGFFFIARTS